MFDIGFWEMAFIGVIALVVIGPERLPGVAHRVGVWVGKSRRMLNEVMADVKKEMKEYDVEQVKTLGDEFKSAGKQLKDITQSATDSLDLKAVGSEFKKSIEAVSPTSSPSDQETDKITKSPATRKPTTKPAIKKSTPRTKIARKRPTKKATKRKPTTKPAIKKPVPLKKTKTKTIKKTASKKPANKAASPTPQKK